MAKGSSYAGQMLRILLNASAIPNVADNAAVSPLTQVAVALHTADPSSGPQNTNEVVYANYLRVLTTRSSAANGWVVTDGSTVVAASASPTAVVTFAQCTSAGSSTTVITHFSVGQSTVLTSGKIFYSGTVTPNVTLGQNVSPQLTTGSSVTET